MMSNPRLMAVEFGRSEMDQVTILDQMEVRWESEEVWMDQRGSAELRSEYDWVVDVELMEKLVWAIVCELLEWEDLEVLISSFF